MKVESSLDSILYFHGVEEMILSTRVALKPRDRSFKFDSNEGNPIKFSSSLIELKLMENLESFKLKKARENRLLKSLRIETFPKRI